jgi:hypothetical protein
MRYTVRRRLGVIIAAVCLALGAAIPAAAEDKEAHLFGPQAEPFDQSYEEWFADYMVWLQEIPLDENPLVEPGRPADCELQDDKVVFVVLGPICHVPEGASVAFDVGWVECSTAEGHGETFSELRRCTEKDFKEVLNANAYSIELRVDGEKIRHPRRFTYLTPGEVVDFPKENLWDVEPGPSRSVTKGFFYMLRPLSEGTHIVRAHLEHEIAGDFRLVLKLRVS